MSRHIDRFAPLLLLLTASVSASACDREHGGGPLGPVDVEQIETRDHREHREHREYAGVLEAEAQVAPVELGFECSLANQRVLAEHSSELVARIRVQAPKQLDIPRPPARVVLVVDTSASMRGEPIEGAKQAARELVDSLAEGDSFSLVVFHSHAEVLLPATIIGDQSRAAARSKIDKMQAWGTTDLADGLRLALAELSLAPVGAELIQRVVLLGDGVANDAGPIAGLTHQFAQRGAEITALGYGLDYDEVLLASLAERTHGHFRFVEEPDAVAALFRDEVLNIQRTVARDVRVGLALGPGVRVLEVVGHPLQWNSGSRRHEVALGSIAEGQSQTLIVRLEVGPHHAGATVELSDLELSFTDVGTGKGDRAERVFLAAIASADQAAISQGRDLDISRAGARARTSAATLQVLGLARDGQLAQAKQQLAAAVSWASSEAAALDDPDLKRQADELASLAPELKALARPRPQAQSQLDLAVGQGGQGSQAGPSPAAQRKVKAAHSAAYNGLHD